MYKTLENILKLHIEKYYTFMSKYVIIRKIVFIWREQKCLELKN